MKNLGAKRLGGFRCGFIGEVMERDPPGSQSI